MHVITTEKKFYTSRYDKVFKTVFAEPVEVLEFLSVEQPLEKITDKRKVLDCLVKVSDKYVNVEINLNDYDTAKAVRNFAYLCSFYNQNTRKGDAYDTETLCVQVNINFGYSPYNRSDKIITKAYMQDEDGVIIDNFSVWNVSVENIKRVCYNSSKERDKYRYILMLDEDKDNLELFYPSDDIVSIYKGEIMRLNSDADFVWDLTPEEDARKLFNTRLRLAEKEIMAQGMAKGIEQGIEQNKIEMIKNFYKIGTSIEDIAKASNLSVEEVKKIINSK